jgi:hypothetical protein
MTTPKSNLPAQFILYISSRHSAADPYSGFILVHATKKMNPASPTAEPLWQITVPPKSTALYRIRTHTDTPLDTYEAFHFQPGGEGTESYCRSTTLWSSVYEIRAPTGGTLPVIEIHKHAKLFAGIVKRNVEFIEVPSPLITPSPTTNTIQHIPATPKPTVGPKSKPTSAFAATTHTIAHRPTIALFVAKRLLELAQLKKEMCPIVAEEFSAGNTAIMPCGHMFAQIAIEESFKKEPNKCPACRQQGTPAYV